jgi:hypothetical protein
MRLLVICGVEGLCPQLSHERTHRRQREIDAIDALRKSRLLANGCALAWEELIDDQRLDEDRVLVSEACAESGRDDQPTE